MKHYTEVWNFAFDLGPWWEQIDTHTWNLLPVLWHVPGVEGLWCHSLTVWSRRRPAAHGLGVTAESRLWG